MKILVLDGNSIINRAFYGIKMLTTKDGRYTNAIVGFMNILFKLKDMTSPDAVAIAFDVKAPTFRHEMYDEYKAGRHAMPEELFAQMPVLKELLVDLGYCLVEKAGWEADDILGTIAHHCRENGDECYIATGDRDSLQLAHGGVKVLLASTKMGQAVTTLYDEELIMEEYGVTPAQLIEVKALMGDASDNIPGVAGIGKKTALDLITKFQTVDNIYENIDTIDVRDNVRNKLVIGKEKAYLSRTLGTIAVDAPVDYNIKSYVQGKGNVNKAIETLTELEMFKVLEKLELKGNEDTFESSADVKENVCVFEIVQVDELIEKLKNSNVYFYPAIIDGSVADIYFNIENSVGILRSDSKIYDEFLTKFFPDESINKFTCNTKELYHKAIEVNAELNGVKMDTVLASYLLNPSANDYSVSRMAQEYRIPIMQINDTLGNCDESSAFCSIMKVLCDKIAFDIEANGMLSLLNDIEIPLAHVLADMEHTGFEADMDGIKEFGKSLGQRLDVLTEGIYEYVGYEFNINSPKQLGEALFEKLNLPAKKKTKSGYSTKAEVLEGLINEHPVIELIIEYRTLAKLKSTYCDGLIKVIGDDDRIHTNFNQVETRTGRISSTEPNLQNIPVRSELGREMRKFFRAKAGCVLVDADYSQIELRVLADMADDTGMIEAFNNNDDIHTITASQVFNLPVEMVTPTMRSRAKAVNFGIVYGIGAFSLAKDIGVTRKEAESYINGYLTHYHGVSRYMDKIIDDAKANGFAKTLFGRRRYLPELASSNGMLRAFGERVARNMPIQGTAADIIKIAMIKVYDRLKKEGLKSKLILQVHDELIVEAPIKEASCVLKLVVEEMENACSMKVKLSSDGKIGKTWYDAKG